LAGLVYTAFSQRIRLCNITFGRGACAAAAATAAAAAAAAVAAADLAEYFLSALEGLPSLRFPSWGCILWVLR